MKRKFTAVLLCVALLIMLSVNALAQNVTDDIDSKGVEDIVSTNAAEPRIQNGSIIDNGVYRIKNVNSGKYLNAHYGVDANGTNVYQWTADGSTEQKWRVSYNLATDAYHVYSMCSSGGKKRCLDAADTGGNLTNGANIRLYEPNEPTSQEMMIVSLGNSQYKIVMKQNSNLCLTAYGTSNGTSGGTTSTSAGNVFISTYTGAANQKWNFEYTNSTVVVAPTGWLDSVSATTIRGWAWRSDLPNSPIKVYFNLVNNDTGDEYNFTTNAGTYRSDLQNAGYGNGCHGFNYTIDWGNYLPGNYTVNVFCAAGAAYYLSGSPKTYTNSTGGGGGTTSYIWPTVSKRITQMFNPGTHYGIDVGAVTTGVAGDPIYCFADGYVSRSEWSSSYGNVVYINHINPKSSISPYIQTKYAHMRDEPLPSVNTNISKGTVIGYMGTTGQSNGVHLHFETVMVSSMTTVEMWINGIIDKSKCIDPLNYFDSSGNVLMYNIDGNDNPWGLTFDINEVEIDVYDRETQIIEQPIAP